MMYRAGNAPRRRAFFAASPTSLVFHPRCGARIFSNFPDKEFHSCPFLVYAMLSFRVLTSCERAAGNGTGVVEEGGRGGGAGARIDPGTSVRFRE